MTSVRHWLAWAEDLAFAPDTGEILFKAALGLAGLSMVGLVSVALFGGVGPAPGLLGVAALLLTPSVVLLVLSRSLPARHSVSVPLIWLLCGMSLMLVLRTPSAADGVSPGWLIHPLMWAVAAVEFCLLVALAWFAWHLWAKGAFSRAGGPGE